jgi:predicted phosphodiesterase
VTTRIAALYDIHGNLPALEAVLEDVRRAGVDRIVVGGDVVPGPMPRETLGRLLSLDVPVQFIHGNGDREVLARMRGLDTEWFRGARPEWRAPIQWTAEQLRGGDEQVLASWPATCRVDVPGLGEVLFCHATARNDTDVVTRLTPDDRVRPHFESVEASLVVCGHTHMQFDRHVGNLRVVNAGSVGMPFQPPGAYWLLLGPGVGFRHTRYDLDAAAKRVRATAYPQASQFADGNILSTPPEADMLDAFTKASLK